MADYFTGEGITEVVVYHVKYGLEGAGFSEYWKLILISSAVSVLFLVYLFGMFKRSGKESGRKRMRPVVPCSLLLISVALNPAPSVF